MTLNGVMAVILRYFSELEYVPGVLCKNSRSLSHLLMSSCWSMHQITIEQIKDLQTQKQIGQHLPAAVIDDVADVWMEIPDLSARYSLAMTFRLKLVPRLSVVDEDQQAQTA